MTRFKGNDEIKAYEAHTRTITDKRYPITFKVVSIDHNRDGWRGVCYHLTTPGRDGHFIMEESPEKGLYLIYTTSQHGMPLEMRRHAAWYQDESLTTPTEVKSAYAPTVYSVDDYLPLPGVRVLIEEPADAFGPARLYFATLTVSYPDGFTRDVHWNVERHFGAACVIKPKRWCFAPEFPST
jgi:hypothetical protein